MSTIELKQFIRETAQNLGFSKIGIAPAQPHPLYEKHLLSWLEKDYHATMSWMKKRSHERGNIHNYFPNAKSVISVALNYFTGTAANKKDTGKISNYAWGNDYHIVLKNKLYQINKNRNEKNETWQKAIEINDIAHKGYEILKNS